LVYPSVRRHPEAFLAFLRQELAKTHYDLVMPMEEETLLLLARHREEFASVARLPIPPYETIVKVRDKGWLLQHAAQQGIPIPRTVWVKDMAELATIKEIIPPPWVIKP
jgi:predicted ATP-grasp superfamily ATP-dependent carboligase